MSDADAIEAATAAPEDLVAIDPLEATSGAMLDGRFRLQRRLGTGSTAVGERWGTELLEALVAMDRTGVDHRDSRHGVARQRFCRRRPQDGP